MTKAVVVPLSDEDLLELRRILLDQDEKGALAFLDQHLKKPAHEALEGGCKVMIDVPGAGMKEVPGKKLF